MTQRSRITEFRYVKADDLVQDDRNWRVHPPTQRMALESMLESVGIVNAVIAREREDGKLVLVDGHLRRDVIDGEVPVLVVDLDEDEAGQVMSTLDPISMMANTNIENLRALVSETLPPVDWDSVMPNVEVLRKMAIAQGEVTKAQIERAETKMAEGRKDDRIVASMECPECGHAFEVSL